MTVEALALSENRIGNQSSRLGSPDWQRMGRGTAWSKALKTEKASGIWRKKGAFHPSRFWETTTEINPVFQDKQAVKEVPITQSGKKKKKKRLKCSR